MPGMEHLNEIILKTWSVAADMAPYLLFGFFVAGLVAVPGRPGPVADLQSGRAGGSAALVFVQRDPGRGVYSQAWGLPGCDLGLSAGHPADGCGLDCCDVGNDGSGVCDIPGRGGVCHGAGRRRGGFGCGAGSSGDPGQRFGRSAGGRLHGELL